LAWVAGKNAVTTYEGAFMASAEADEACLARMYPDYDALTEDGRFEVLAHAVYGPLLQWAQQITAEPHATLEASQEVAA
jgi:exodeoxyribonuclease V gamma subunit